MKMYAYVGAAVLAATLVAGPALAADSTSTSSTRAMRQAKNAQYTACVKTAWSAYSATKTSALATRKASEATAKITWKAVKDTFTAANKTAMAAYKSNIAACKGKKGAEMRACRTTAWDVLVAAKRANKTTRANAQTVYTNAEKTLVQTYVDTMKSALDTYNAAKKACLDTKNAT